MRAMPETAATLFQRYFLPLYPADAAADLARARSTDANPARNPAVFAHLDDAAEIFRRKHGELFGADLGLDYGDASVHRLSAALTRERRDRWAASGAAGTPENELFNVVVHGAAYVGACVVHSHGGTWAVRRPLWESLVRLSSRAGEGDLAVFHWWLKALSDDALSGRGGAGTLADRYRAWVELPTARPEALPPIAPPDRRLPRIAKGVRYDVLHKHLKAHLPELRDLGEHFPTPERFAAYGFEWLDFLWLGGGRMLLLFGLGAGGLHLFWLTHAGFEKSALVACDPFPAPTVRATGDTITCIIHSSGATRTVEMLWWGP
jgi:hypothetical protein